MAGGGVHGRHVDGGPGVAAVDVNRGVLPDPALGPAGPPDVQADHLHQIARPAHLEVLLRERGTYSGLVREFVSAPYARRLSGFIFSRPKLDSTRWCLAVASRVRSRSDWRSPSLPADLSGVTCVPVPTEHNAAPGIEGASTAPGYPIARSRVATSRNGSASATQTRTLLARLQRVGLLQPAGRGSSPLSCGRPGYNSPAGSQQLAADEMDTSGIRLAEAQIRFHRTLKSAATPIPHPEPDPPTPSPAPAGRPWFRHWCRLEENNPEPLRIEAPIAQRVLQYASQLLRLSNSVPPTLSPKSRPS